jgi:hypothetical protein
MKDKDQNIQLNHKTDPAPTIRNQSRQSKSAMPVFNTSFSSSGLSWNLTSFSISHHSTTIFSGSYSDLF